MVERLELCDNFAFLTELLRISKLKNMPNTYNWSEFQRYTYRVLQTIQMKLILSWVWAEWAVLGRPKAALKLKYEI